MAEQQRSTEPFPAPPPFYKHFTPSNLEQLRKARKEAAKEGNDLDILALPTELRYLIPPSPAENGEARAFSGHLSLTQKDPTLEESGIEQLYPLTSDAKLNPQPHLIGLTRSLLTTFLALTGVLSRNPEQYLGRVEDLQLICYNIHDLVNQYRPHQARESLIMMMEERIQRLREETRRVREGKGKVEELMVGLVERDSGALTDEKNKIVGLSENREKSERNEERQESAWAAIEEALDTAEPGE